MSALATVAWRLPLPPLTASQREALRALPFEIVSGLRILRDEPAPTITRPDVWDEIATDAIMLAADGWAGRALDLGWDPLELFGCAIDPYGDDVLLGVAGQLRGRQVAAITATAAHLRHSRDRSTIYRRRRVGAVTFLWSYGR